MMNDSDKAIAYYERVLLFNQYNVQALTSMASIYRMKDPPEFQKAVELYHQALKTEDNNTEIWGNLGHCFLMMDDLTKAYTAYHQAIYNAKLQNKTKQDPHLWYGIGILYERCNSLDNAEESFRSVLKMDAQFEKINEIYFRLGIIYKQQKKYEQSLECFGHILKNPPSPLTEADIWFQIGHVYELKKDFQEAKTSYEKVLKFNPNHSKVLQQLGWLFHQNTEFQNQEAATHYLQRSVDADPSSGQTWYLLGRCFMAQKKYRFAYSAYQQAVFRDGKNPTFWCSIGVLYYQINQYRDALDAYSRAIRLNPYLSEVWYDLGTLYESCQQIPDAVDAYQRAADLDQSSLILQKLQFLKNMGNNPQPEEAKNLTAVEPPIAATQQPSHHGFFPNTSLPPPNIGGIERPPQHLPPQGQSYPPLTQPPQSAVPPMKEHNGYPQPNYSHQLPQMMNHPGQQGTLPPYSSGMSNNSGGVMHGGSVPPSQQAGLPKAMPPGYPGANLPPGTPIQQSPPQGNFGPNQQFNAIPSTQQPLPPQSYTSYPPNSVPSNVPLGEPASPMKRRVSPTPQPELQSETKRVKQTPKGGDSDDDEDDEQDQMVIHDPEDSESNVQTPKIVGTATDIQNESSEQPSKVKSRFVRNRKSTENQNPAEETKKD